MKATELAGELIKWRRTEAKRGPAAWLSERIQDVEAEIDAREEPAPPGQVARGIDQVQPQAAGSHAVMVSDSDPWVRLQRFLLAQAERNGDSARAAFYRAVLAGEPLPGVPHQRRRAR